MKPRFSQYGLQHYESSKEKTRPARLEEKKRVASNSPQVKTTTGVKVKQKEKLNTNITLIGQKIKQNEPKPVPVVKLTEEKKERSVFHNSDGCYRVWDYELLASIMLDGAIMKL